MTRFAQDRALTVFIVAGEESGDQLGAGLMRALIARLDGKVQFLGVGGARMQALGLDSIFPMHEVSLHGVSAIIRNIGRIIRRQRQVARAVLAAQPDVFIAVDLPGFNLGVARRVRKIDPSIATVQYVSPSVWAYRPGRARFMAGFIDRILAILPFEPEVHRRLGGPPCTYVGHLLIEHLDKLRPAPSERQPIETADPPTLLVLPGSRRTEIGRLLAPFGETVARVAATHGPLEIVLPAVPHLRDEIEREVARWPVKPMIVQGEEEKLAAFRRAHAALVASGTVTLELALSGVPMVVAYRIDMLLKWIKLVFQAKSIVLSNLVLGESVIPEFIDKDSSPEQLAAALAPLLRASPERARQLAAFERLDDLMTLGGTTPNTRAAEVVLETIAERQRRLETGT
ncbi:MAG TPA: lipid-A-disaccharide synthase [Pararhizobium sp.]|nr:lipid-A-disaccharide synthase [Pararhizobium sp.]